MGVAALRGGDAVLVRGVQAAVADVLHDRAGKQVGVLQHHAQGAPEVVLPYILYVDAVVGDGAGLHVVEPVDQVGDGGLARAGGAHECDLLAGLGVEAQILQHVHLPVVGEGHVVEAHVALQGDALVAPDPGPLLLPHLLQGVFPLVHLHGGVHEIEDALRASQGVEDARDLLGDHVDGPGNLLAVLQIRGQGADVHEPLDDEGGAGHGADGEEDVAGVAHDGHEDHAVGVGLGGGVPQVLGQLPELRLHLPLMAEHLHLPLALEVLLHVAAGGGDGGLPGPEVLGAELGEAAHKAGHDEEDSQHQDGQLPVHKEHGHQDPQEGHGAADHVGEGVR